MRITLTIDDDVTRLLEAEMHQSGSSLDETVNRYLRISLPISKNQSRKPFVVEPIAMGLPPGMSYDKVNELLAMLECPRCNNTSE